ncbi:MAG TPA: DUF4157 domain-containing protein [Bryobacteraceae bacterium]|jgi:hypothetical protein|nr:DUF4157 domain-containing protein [Bryobacteraceae bacterium]
MSQANKRDRDAETDERSSIKTSAEPAVSPVKEAPRLAPAQSALLDLQRSHGNQFVVELLHRNGGGQPLDEDARAGMEQRLGQDFGQVRVHNDAQSARAAEALDAQAFTVGRDVYFGSGKYHPGPADPLLAHELVHVAQQSRGASPTAGQAGLEAQADLAEQAVTGRAAGVEISAGSQGVQRKADDSSETATTAPQQQQQQQKQKSPSFFDRLGHGISQAAGAVWKGVETAGAAIGKAAVAVGHGIATAAEAIWNGLQWVGRQLWDKVTGVFERVMHWVSRLPERLARLVRGLWEGVRSLHPWALKWWESLAQADTWVDFLKWLSTAALNILEVMGIGEVYETAMEFIKFNTRKMTGTEMDEATSVFGSSINIELVRIDEYAVLGPSWTKREYTSFHTINGWGGN